jgi:tetratricopeptide (TPR) repeat protein
MKSKKSKPKPKAVKISAKTVKNSSKKNTELLAFLNEKFSQAHGYMHSGDEDFAKRGRALFLKIARMKPNFKTEEGDNPYYYLGIYCASNPKQRWRAINYFTKSIKLDPKDAEAYRDRGTCRMNSGDKSGAIRDLKKAKSVSKDMTFKSEIDEIIAEYSKGQN